MLSSWSPGTVHTSSWLSKKGYSARLLFGYRESGWIYAIGNGAYGRVGDRVSWEGAMYALQKELGLSIHPGGKTALSLGGASHFVPMGTPPITLFGERKDKLPAWFRGHDWRAKIEYHPTQLFQGNSSLGLTEYKRGGFSIQIASRERAILEFLHLVPQEETFEHARLLMQGLLSLRPALVQQLLLACSSIKVRRLFMILAERFKMPWLGRIDTAQIDFGRAKRRLCEGGKLHPKYLLSVPPNFFDQE